MKKIFTISLIIFLGLLFSSSSFAQKKADNDPTLREEMSKVEGTFYETEAIKKIGTALARGALDKSNQEAVAKTTQEIWKYSKDMSKGQMQKFLARLSKMSNAGINQLKKMTPRQINGFVADAVGGLSKNAGVLKQIIAGAGDKAGNMALQTISQVDDIIANNGKVPKALYVKLKNAASKLPPEKAKAYLDLLKKKFSSDWADIVNLEDASKGPASLVGTLVDGVFVLNDAYDIYYSDDEPEVKAIKATGKMIDYGTSTAAGAGAAALGAGELAFTAGLGVGLTIAFTANRVSTLYTEIAILQKEKEAAKNAEKNEKIDNEILIRRQLVNINGKIKAGQISNAQFLLVKLQKFILNNKTDNEEKLLDLRSELEDKANQAERNQLINEIINKAKFPYNKALNFYQRGVELKDAKTFAAEALSILQSNVKKYPEITGLKVIAKTRQLIKAINEKIASAADFVLTEVAAPEKVYVGQSIVIPAYVKGGIPYYNAYGATHSFFTDNTKINMNWDAPSEPGIEKFTIKLKDCMGSIASASVSIEVVERTEEDTDDKKEQNTEVEDNSPGGLEGCWVGWTVCGSRHIDCPLFQYFFKIETKKSVRYYSIWGQVQIINGKYSVTCEDGFSDENIRKNKIKGEGWELYKFNYPEIPELPETSNETYRNYMQELTSELKSTEDESKRLELQMEIEGINDRIKQKTWSRIFYETALEWTNENKWQDFNYPTDEDEYYNGYADWWMCPDEVLSAFENELKSKSY